MARPIVAADPASSVAPSAMSRLLLPPGRAAPPAPVPGPPTGCVLVGVGVGVAVGVLVGVGVGVGVAVDVLVGELLGVGPVVPVENWPLEVRVTKVSWTHSTSPPPPLWV
jgi:hypothetical protein